MSLRIVHYLAKILWSDDAALRGGKRLIFPVLRLLLVFLCILLCALSQNAIFTVCVIAAGLLRTALLSGSRIRRVIGPPCFSAACAALILIPAVWMGYPGTLGTVTMKVFESVLLLSLLGETVPWKDLTGSMASLGLPGIFVYTLDSTVRYLVILGRFASRLSEAVWLRTFRRKNWRRSGAGGVLGTVFLKSSGLAEAQYEAMLCRGYRGTYRVSAFRQMHLRDLGAADRLANAAYGCLFPLVLALFLALR